MRAALLKLGVLLGYIAASQTASADTILLPSPDLLVSEVAVSYDAVSGNFTATGYASGFSHDNNGGFWGVASEKGSFSLTANINTSGVASGGTLSVSGCIQQISPGCSTPGSVLLASLVLSYLEFGGPDSTLTFGFSTLNGDLALLYGTIAYVQLSNIAFPGNFLFSFNNNPTNPLDPFQGQGDIGTAAIPEPGTWAMMFIGVGLIILAKRNSARKTT